MNNKIDKMSDFEIWFLNLKLWQHILLFLFTGVIWITIFIYCKVHENNIKGDAYLKELKKPIITYNNYRIKNNKLTKEKISFQTHYNLKKYKTINNYIICNKHNKNKNSISYNSIEYIDILSGLEFETYMSKLLSKLGYKNVKLTPASNDYGIDLIAEKDDVKFAIQCKHYAGKVSNSSIQEANSGKQYYNCHIGVVVTNSYFTPNATFLAKNNGIILWDRKKLITMLKIANDEV